MIVGARPDDQFYIVSGPDLTGAYTSTARDLDELKLNFILREKLNARTILAPTDWLLIRKEETSDAVPATVTNFRAAVRTANSTRCNEINAAADVAALEALIKAPEQIEDVSNPGTFIANPDGLTSYPDTYDEEASVAADYGL